MLGLFRDKSLASAFNLLVAMKIDHLVVYLYLLYSTQTDGMHYTLGACLSFIAGKLASSYRLIFSSNERKRRILGKKFGLDPGLTGKGVGFYEVQFGAHKEEEAKILDKLWG